MYRLYMLCTAPPLQGQIQQLSPQHIKGVAGGQMADVAPAAAPGQIHLPADGAIGGGNDHYMAVLDEPGAPFDTVDDLIKFYGMRGSTFFYWFYPFDDGHSKYGLEAINGKSKGLDFDIEQLEKICADAAEALGVDIYGGDCIISPTGEIRIIDFNDWPSFAPCRNEAAPFIAKCVLKLIKNKLKQ